MRDPALRGLYAITDETLIPLPDFTDRVEQALLGGARLIQYRDKTNDAQKRLLQAGALRKLCSEHNAMLIINDDIELTLKTNADGVHLGRHDIDIVEARNILGNNKIIGQSCYNDLELARRAQADSADYVAFGAFFDSPTKSAAVTAQTHLLKSASSQLDIAVCAIGGIKLSNARALVTEGADMIAVISSLFATPHIRNTARAFSTIF